MSAAVVMSVGDATDCLESASRALARPNRLDCLTALADAGYHVDNAIRALVTELRGSAYDLTPASWSMIGAALGVTRQAAQQRYGP